MEYLRHQCVLTKAELEECAKVSNFVLRPSGELVIGHGMVIHETKHTTSEPLPPSLDEWLKEIGSFLSIDIIYADGYNESNWDWVMARSRGKSASHLRMLSWFTEYAVPSFSVASEKLDAMLESLEEIRMRRKVDFRDIRQACLNVYPGPYLFRPCTEQQVSFGDICYMDEKTWSLVTLLNVLDRLSLPLEPEPIIILTCAGDCYEMGEPDGESGVTTHRYIKPACATIRRYTKCEMTKHWREAWEFLIANASHICETHSNGRLVLRPEDLILITGVQTDLRFSLLDWKSGDGLTLADPPSEISFAEIDATAPGQPWGHWLNQNKGNIMTVQGTTEVAGVDCGEGITVTSFRFPQNIMFVHLEKDDLDSNETSRICEVE